MPERGKTSRGFAVYAELTDASGSEIRVQKSSLATDDAVWIFAGHPDGHVIPARFTSRLAAAGFTTPLHLAELGAMLEPSPQLNVEQAKTARDALDEFIREHETEGGN